MLKSEYVGTLRLVLRWSVVCKFLFWFLTVLKKAPACKLTVFESTFVIS